MDILGHLGIFDYSNSRAEVIKHLTLAPIGTDRYFIENNCLRIARRMPNPVQTFTKSMRIRFSSDMGFNSNARELQCIQLMPIRITYHALEQYHLRADENWPNIESLIKMQENISTDGLTSNDNDLLTHSKFIITNESLVMDIPNFFHPVSSGGFIGMVEVGDHLKYKSFDHIIVNRHWDKFQNKWLGEYLPEGHQIIIKTYIGPNEISREKATFTLIDWYKNTFHYSNNEKKWKDYLDRLDA